MSRRRGAATAALVVAAATAWPMSAVARSAVQTRPAWSDVSCSLQSNEDSRRGKASIFGTPVRIPPLRVETIDVRAGQAVIAAEILVFYIWRWLEPPNAEYPGGAWDEAQELVRCLDVSSSRVRIPRREIVPRGWFNGRLPFPHNLFGSRTPKFDRVELRVVIKGCAPTVSIPFDQLRRFETSSARVATGCDRPANLSFVKEP